jgi:hypothetical protein
MARALPAQKEVGYGGCDARRRHGAARLRAEDLGTSRLEGGSSERYTSRGRLQRAAAVVHESDFDISRRFVISTLPSAW